ncbi:hypothetical protein H4R19_000412 [Coemansia spiralis]|nr:hypothetical protein H4R19_000412 [Coemansia spiralis]
MSFEYTEREKLRVSMASLFGVTYDPIGYSDLATVCAWAGIYAAQLVAVGYTLWHRNYPPLQTCRPVLMALFWAAGVLWFVGDITSNVMVHLSHAPLNNCMLLVIWMRSSLGQNMLFFLLLYRCTSLHFEYRLGRAMCALERLSVGAFLMVCDFLPSVISTVMPTVKTLTYIPGLEVCLFYEPFKVAMVTLTWVELGTLVAIVALLNATMNCAHREHRRLAAACVPLVISACLHSVVFFRRPLYPSSLGWRIAVVSVEQASALCAWWLIMGPAVYNCMFRRRQHLLEWRQASAATTKRHPGLQDPAVRFAL